MLKITETGLLSAREPLSQAVTSLYQEEEELNESLKSAKQLVGKNKSYPLSYPQGGLPKGILLASLNFVPF